MRAHLRRWLSRASLRRTRRTPRSALPSPPRICTLLVVLGALSHVLFTLAAPARAANELVEGYEKAFEWLALPRELAARIPERIGDFPIHDPDGFYFGFAVSGYGLKGNYAKARALAEQALAAAR